MKICDKKLHIILICLILGVFALILRDLSTSDPRITRNFRLSEFLSPDTGEAKMDMEVILRLQAVRDHFGKDVIVLSGYRTPAYNRKVGGHPKSLHLNGMAMDWYIKGVSVSEMARVARECGFTGIGLYKYSVHTDIGESETWYGK